MVPCGGCGGRGQQSGRGQHSRRQTNSRSSTGFHCKRPKSRQSWKNNCVTMFLKQVHYRAKNCYNKRTD